MNSFAGNGLVLLYNAGAQRESEIRLLCLRHGIRMSSVPAARFGVPLKDLLPSGSGSSVQTALPAGTESFSEEMMLICGLSRQELMLFLEEFQKQDIRPVALKAVLTEHNQSWDSITLYREISREHAMMHGKPLPS